MQLVFFSFLFFFFFLSFFYSFILPFFLSSFLPPSSKMKLNSKKPIYYYSSLYLSSLETCQTTSIAGVCTPNAGLTSLSFCGKFIAQYTLPSTCVPSLLNATTIDQSVQSGYNSGSANLKQTTECLDLYAEILCVAEFPQCTSSNSSVFLCQSTCENYFYACAGQKITCTASEFSGLPPVVVGGIGPSATCTGEASGLIPSIISVALLVFAAFTL